MNGDEKLVVFILHHPWMEVDVLYMKLDCLDPLKHMEILIWAFEDELAMSYLYRLL